MKTISVIEVEYVAHRLAKETMVWTEPIPDFKTRYPNILESCLATPFQRFDGKSPYPQFTHKAAVLFYLMVKNHPFQNGNKRVAIVTLLFFMLKNGKWLKVDNMEFYNFAKWIAASPAKLKIETIAAVKKFIEGAMVEMNH